MIGMKRAAGVALIAMATALAAPATAQDSFQWLETPTDPRALEWAARETARSQAAIAAMPERAAIAAELTTLLEAGDPPPQYALLGPVILKFQRSTRHPHGVMSVARREANGGPGAWRDVLDIDALRAAEGIPYELQFYGMDSACAPPEFERCLLRLSPSGGDEVDLREFDLRSGTFVADGFRSGVGRNLSAWLDSDHLLIEHTLNGAPTLATQWPRQVSIWTRGTPLEAAKVVYSAEPTDAVLWVSALGTGDGRVGLISRFIDFSTSESILVRPNGALEHTSVPAKLKTSIGYGSSNASSLGGTFLSQLAEPATVNSITLPAETVISYNTAAEVPETERIQVVYTPQGDDFLSDGFTGLSQGLTTVRMVLENRGRKRVVTARQDGADWRIEEGAPEAVGVNISLAASNPAGDDFVAVRSGYLLPAQSVLLDGDAQPVTLSAEAPAFDASRFSVELKTTVSPDGTEIDYFLVAPKTLENPGETPTLMTGYGAFGVGLAPSYLSYIEGGRSLAHWLNRGGAFVLPLIRGGGERGAAWHQSAIRENRQRSYDDFAAVTEDLIADGFTRPEHIGVFGSSNGGLLAAVMGTQRPDLYGALVVDVPLTDLIRMPFMGVGAAWTNEYGDPTDPAMVAVLNRYSPYQVVEAGTDYPPFLITTATSDNRVGPGHARKFAARLIEAGATAYFIEDQEGGHGVSDPLSRPELMADRMTFLFDTLR